MRIIFLLLLLSNNALFAQNKNLDKSIFAVADSIYKKANVTGIGIGYYKDKKGTFFGLGNIKKGSKDKFTSSTVFEIGSITKTFTAYVLQKTLTNKNISDTTKIINYLPDSLHTNAALAEISFLQLLNHTSGLERIPTNMQMDKNPYKNYTKENLFTYLKTVKLNAKKTYDYSNTGFALAGILAEIISGKKYNALVQELILKEFKVGYYIPEKDTRKKAQGYFDNEAIDYWDWDCMAPCGGLKMDMGQVIRYLSYLIYPTNTESKTVIDNITKPTNTIAKSLEIGKAWHILTKENNTYYWHNGGTYGFSTFCGFNKTNNTAVIVVVNQFNKNQFSDGLGIKILSILSK